MQYKFDNIDMYLQGRSYNKNSSIEVLQYAVGALLYMPASNTKIAQKIISKEYSFIHSMVLDLEDSLGNDMVSFGQKNIATLMKEIDDAILNGIITIDDVPLIFIRVREKGQIKKAYEILGKNIVYITGLNIPKFDKTCCDAYIKEFVQVEKEVYSKYGTNLYIMPIIENKLAMYRQLRMDNLLYINNALRPISTHVLNIRVGGADFCSIFGIRRSADECIHDIGVVRSVFADIVNVFGKNYIVSGPVWEYFGSEGDNGRWLSGLRHELKYDNLNGFLGKTAIHPTQVAPICESLIVSKQDYLDAIDINGMNDNIIGVKKSTGEDSRMNEVKTHRNWARKVISLANIYGVRND